MLHTIALCLCSAAVSAAPVDADLVIRGAILYDGTGQPGVKGDLAIKGDRIVGVGSFEVKGTPRVLDGTGLFVAPGFIDLHNHSDAPILAASTRGNVNFLTQGVTTVVTGNCGAGPVDVADYYKKITSGKAGTNIAHQIPHNTLRRRVMGEANSPPSKAELEKMKALIDKGMKEGAWGLATGLYYTPGSYADTDELVELSKVVARHGGFYASHMRDEGTGLLASVTEVLAIGKRAGLPVHISHMKAFSRRAWGTAADAVSLVEAAQKKGQTVTADQYPYTASSTSLAADVIPTAFREGTQKDILARLDNPEKGPKMRQAIERQIKACDDGRALRIARYTKKPAWQGKTLAALAAAEKKTPLEIAIEIERNGGAQIVNFSMKEEDVQLIMKRPWVATASDGSAMARNDTVPHPRNYGCFPRKIGRHAIEEKLLPVEQAIRSATGLPADILHLPERGYLKVGYFADVAVLDPKTFRDTATFDNPHQYATGVAFLFVNGTVAVEKGKPTGALAGKALRHVSGKR
ncbi:MAG TPA: D-aminoacylase [Gemmataceae bacterium]|nr:D-aminoacylase [Gemmataceae bacterium]